MATVVGQGELAEGAPYRYIPFSTLASLGAFAYSLAWTITFVQVRRLLARGADQAFSADDLVGIGATIAVFMWGRQELSAAFSPRVAVLALVVYYALAGVALIYTAQLRQSLHLRPVGLALSIYASLKAVFETLQMEIGVRVAGLLVSGIFLLAVAHWYQKSDVPTGDPQQQAA